MVNKNFVAKLYNYCNTQLKCHQEKKEQKKKIKNQLPMGCRASSVKSNTTKKD